MNKPDDDDIIMHPSTLEWYETFLDYGETDPVIFVEGVLHELFIPFIQALVQYGWDVQSPQFIKDFTSLLEVAKAILYRQYDMHHPVQDGLDGIPPKGE